MRKFLIIEKVKIEDANAFSSPYSVGFPAMPAFAGFMHKMQRELLPLHEDLKFCKIGIVSNDFNLRANKPSKKSTANTAIIGKRLPLMANGKTESFIEEPLCNLTVTFVIEYTGIKKIYEDKFKENVENLLRSRVKIASGNVIEIGNIDCKRINEDEEDSEKNLLRRLTHGFAIINRRDLIEADMKENNMNAYDSIISYLQVNYKSYKNEEDEIRWESSKREKGWFIPIGVGFQGITDIIHVDNQRSNDYPHRFVESVATLGEFVMPYRLSEINQMLWQYEYDEENKLYIIR